MQVYRDLPPEARGYCGTIYLTTADPEQLLNQVSSLYGGGRYRVRPLTPQGEFAPGSCMVDLPGPPRVNPQNWTSPAAAPASAGLAAHAAVLRAATSALETAGMSKEDIEVVPMEPSAIVASWENSLPAPRRTWIQGQYGGAPGVS